MAPAGDVPNERAKRASNAYLRSLEHTASRVTQSPEIHPSESNGTRTQKVRSTVEFTREDDGINAEATTVVSDANAVTQAPPCLVSPQTSPERTHIMQPPQEEPANLEELYSEDSDGAFANPLAATTASYFVDPYGQPRFLGGSSTLSFGFRVFALLEQNFSQAPSLPFHEPGSAYDLSSPRARCSIPIFTRKLYRFYDDPTLAHAEAERLWFVQFLLVIAFGKAFVVQKRQIETLPGSEYFIRALSLLPECQYFFRDALTAIEVLTAISLYYESVDSRNTAYNYIGQALRIALGFGLHRERPPNQSQYDSTERCRNLWWTVYILERNFTTSMGLPICLQDHDITASLPNTQSDIRKGVAISFLVKSSKIVAQTVDRLFSPSGRLHSNFLVSIHFLVFDRELTYSAAFVLNLISIIAPGMVPINDLNQEVVMILEEMIAQGSVPAGFRKSELEALYKVQDFILPLDEPTPPPTAQAEEGQSSMEGIPNRGMDLLYSTNYTGVNLDAFNALSPEQLLSVAQLLPFGNEPAMQGNVWPDDWL
ncbi:hypothetical protein N7465_010576 [Penicillium sp. CMV-2018d]|nr:hypothetical protein N7465_010576 [Penicillium sp. CMV-2018d]